MTGCISGGLTEQIAQAVLKIALSFPHEGHQSASGPGRALFVGNVGISRHK
jgi:hypothetical protein